MNSLRLSEHFVLSEFERSATAEANNIDNSCPSQYIPALSQLCKTILEPLRAYANSPEGKQSLSLSPSQEIPIVISSGYRCPTLNIKVGGVYSSQHTLGEAADIVPLPPAGSNPSTLNHKPSTLKQWFDWLKENTDFDQLILEHNSKGSYWIHVSCRKNIKANRHQVFYDLKKK